MRKQKRIKLSQWWAEVLHFKVKSVWLKALISWVVLPCSSSMADAHAMKIYVNCTTSNVILIWQNMPLLLDAFSLTFGLTVFLEVPRAVIITLDCSWPWIKDNITHSQKKSSAIPVISTQSHESLSAIFKTVFFLPSSLLYGAVITASPMHLTLSGIVHVSVGPLLPMDSALTLKNS